MATVYHGLAWLCREHGPQIVDVNPKGFERPEDALEAAVKRVHEFHVSLGVDGLDTESCGAQSGVPLHCHIGDETAFAVTVDQGSGFYEMTYDGVIFSKEEPEREWNPGLDGGLRYALVNGDDTFQGYSINALLEVRE